jgi:hypothetical protein
VVTGTIPFHATLSNARPDQTTAIAVLCSREKIYILSYISYSSLAAAKLLAIARKQAMSLFHRDPQRVTVLPTGPQCHPGAGGYYTAIQQ